MQEFATRGLSCVRGLLPPERVRPAQQVLQRALERHGLWCDGEWRLDHLAQTTLINAGADLVKPAKKSNALAEVITRELLDVVTALLDDRKFAAAMDIPQILFTLPNAATWTVPHAVWHLDVPRLPQGGAPGVQIFTFLNTVAPGGGGTLVVAGSHRLLNTGERIASRDVKKRLKREPYFKALMSRDTGDRLRFVQEPGRVGDVEVQVVELCGEPGDVYFVDMRMLHTLAPNTAPVPRMMLTHRYLLEDMRESIYGN